MKTCQERKVPRVVVACASFKGTLSSSQAGRALARGLKRAGWRTKVVALADGGEGLVEALARAVTGSRTLSVPCRGPHRERRRARLAILPRGNGRKVCTAVIEMAASSGLQLVPADERDPQLTTTLGVGDQLRAALDHGARAILLGLGGSATNDAGAGMAQALGVRLLDAQGCELPPGGAALARLARIEMSKLDPRLKRTPVLVACDVRNPLCGKLGASAVFGPQKGATPAAVRVLDRALSNFARVVQRELKRNVQRVAGAGAAGGLGAGCLAFLEAQLVPGIELVLDATGFDELLRDADLVVTGEGRLDRQTLMGKTPAGVAARAKLAGVPCVAVGGCFEAKAAHSLRRVFARTHSLSDFAGSSSQAKRRTAFWLEKLGQAQAKDWKNLISRKAHEKRLKLAEK